MHLSGGRDEGVAMEDRQAFARAAGEGFETLAEVDFFAGEQCLAEPTDLTEGRGVAEDKRARGPLVEATEEIPEREEEPRDRISAGGVAVGDAVAGVRAVVVEVKVE